MSVLHPVGRLDPKVYWLRRGIVILGALLLIWGLVSLFTPRDNGVAGVPVPGSPSPSLSTSSAPSPSGSMSPSASTGPSTSPSAAPTGPVACDPLNVDVALAGFKSIVVDGKQTFSVSITNNTAVSCILDVTSASFVLKVVSGSDPIWTTADCAKLVVAKKTTLKAGGAYEFKLTWPGKRSTANCGLAKSSLGAGTYIASATYSEQATGKFVFVLTKKK